MVTRIIPTLCVLVVCSAAWADTKPAAKPWAVMDRGPYFSASVESNLPSRQITHKGLLICVDKKLPAYVLFDTDLLRCSAAWTGGSINWQSVVFDGSHQTWPKVVGSEVFGTPMTPGWAHDGSFEDPRTRYPATQYRPEPDDWKNRAYGPLPHEWGRYKGLYLHGDRVVLSCTAGKTAVLETAGLERSQSLSVFTRTLNLAPHGGELVLEVLAHPGARRQFVASVPQEGSKASPSANDLLAVLGEISPTAAQQPATRPAAVEKGKVHTWEKLAPGAGPVVAEVPGVDLGGDFSVAAWVKTSAGGTILSKSSAGKWVTGGKSFFIEDGRPTLDIGWVGAVRGSKVVNDDKWHHVAVTRHAQDGTTKLYVDGVVDATGRLKATADPAGSRYRLGLTSDDFPRGDGNRLVGELESVHLYSRPLTPEEVAQMAGPHRAAATPVVAAAVKGAPPAAKWEFADGGHLRLHLPASTEPTKLKLLTAAVSSSTGVGAFQVAVAASGAAEDLDPLTHGGPPRWPQTLTTETKPAAVGDGAYVADELTVPTDNPWKALMRFGGFDFFADGKRAALCTWDGDVWTVAGLDDPSRKLTWKRIATGMFQPLGLKIVPDEQGRELVYVCCRDQITRLCDLNGDGEIDFYECFNNDHQVTEHFHEFAMGLQTDPEGDFYYTKSARHALDAVVPQHGTLLKVSKDGSKTEIIGTGFRAANGFGMSDGGEMAVSDQEGYWTPADRINLLKKDGFYGNLWAYSGKSRTAEQLYDPPLVWLPVKVDRSPAEELWCTSSKWGPLQGRMIHTSYGTGQIFLVPYEVVNGVPQGGAVPLPGLKFKTGVMRARFHPNDGQLYVSGMVGWASNCAEPTGFYRIRYTGQPVCLPEAIHVLKDGVSLTFTTPLDPAAAADAESYGVQQWQYRWTKSYGSAHYSIADPEKKAQDDVTIAGAVLSDDRRTVTLKIPAIKPVMQMRIDVNVKDAAGKDVKLTIHNTINQVPQ